MLVAQKKEMIKKEKKVKDITRIDFSKIKSEIEKKLKQGKSLDKKEQILSQRPNVIKLVCLFFFICEDFK